VKDGLREISRSLINLSSLTLTESPAVPSEDLDSLSLLTNLEKLFFGGVTYLNEDDVANYSTLTNLRSIHLLSCVHFPMLGLISLLINKPLLVHLAIDNCHKISAEGYYCISKLTNLTSLSIKCKSRLNNNGLILISNSCLLIKELCIRCDHRITKVGLSSFHCLNHLESLSLNIKKDAYMAQLSQNTSLTHLDLSDSYISDHGLSYLPMFTKLKTLTLRDYFRNFIDEPHCNLRAILPNIKINFSTINFK
jgi:hypothetical protein